MFKQSSSNYLLLFPVRATFVWITWLFSTFIIYTSFRILQLTRAAQKEGKTIITASSLPLVYLSCFVYSYFSSHTITTTICHHHHHFHCEVRRLMGHPPPKFYSLAKINRWINKSIIIMRIDTHTHLPLDLVLIVGGQAEVLEVSGVEVEEPWTGDGQLLELPDASLQALHHQPLTHLAASKHRWEEGGEGW